MKRLKYKHKPDEIIRLIETIESCKLIESNQANGNYMFKTEDKLKIIGCTHNKETQRLSLIFLCLASGKTEQRLI